MSQQKAPFLQDLPQGVILVLFIPRTATALSSQCWPHPDLAATLGDPASLSGLRRRMGDMGSECPALPGLAPWGDRLLFTTFFPFPRVTKALPEPPGPR